nr:retrovirus-related Pol polyprotein from transposon TNT 1-94 [Tanacetum cinerariifolium]
TKDETSSILRKFITEIENLKDLKVKIIRCDNGGEFKNKELNDFCSQKGIKREFSNARTPQQNGVAGRRNRSLIEAARTITSAIGFLKPFGCHVMILNTLDNLGKFEAKGDEGYFLGYLMSSKVFRIFNKRTKKVEENVHIEFLENKAEEKGSGLNWLIDIDSLTKSINYVPVVDTGTRNTDVPESSGNSNPTATSTNPPDDQLEALTVETLIPIASSPVSTICFSDSQEPLNILRDTSNSKESNGVEADVSNMEITITASPTPTLKIHRDHPKSQIIGPVDTPIQTRNKSKEVEAMQEELLQFKIQKVWSLVNCPKGVRHIGTKWVLKNKKDERGIVVRNKARLVAQGHTQEEGIDYDEVFVHVARIEAIRLFLAYASFMGFTVYQMDVKSAFLNGTIDEKVSIGTKWVLKNKKDERGIVIRNKARLVAQGHTQEEGIDYDEVFSPVARIEAIRLFLAYASFMGFIVYQMDVKSAFLYGTIDEEVYLMQPPGFQDPKSPAKVYKVEKAMYGLHQAPRACAMSELNFFLGLQVLQKEDGIFLSQDKYVRDILKKFGYSDVRSSNTPMNKENPWGKDETGKDVDLHFYRSMIGSLMYLTTSRPDIMFSVCAYARHQVTLKECHLHTVKRIFRYLKGHPKLGLWYPKESPFGLVAYSDSDYGGATQDRKSTTKGYQFFGRRLISWQCKKQTIVATSTTEAEYFATASGCGQVLWI